MKNARARKKMFLIYKIIYNDRLSTNLIKEILLYTFFTLQAITSMQK